MSWGKPQISDLVGCKKKIKKLTEELNKINRPDRVVAIMMQIKSTANMYNHCYYELIKNGMTEDEYYKQIVGVNCND